MTHILYIVRHAEAESWNPLGNDFSRNLKTDGIRHARALATWVTQNLESPDTVLCSPAKRTRETLSPLLAQWPRLLSATDYMDSMYGASVNMLLTLAEDAFSYSTRLLLVGHNPGCKRLLLNSLEPGQASNIDRFAPGTLAVVEFANGFRQNAQTGCLLHLVRRSDLSVD